MARRPSHRRGSYNTFLGLLVPVMLGFAALSVDTSYMRLVRSQAQDVTDAAAHAALIELRRSGSEVDAEAVAEEVVSLNKIGTGPGRMLELEFGDWAQDGSGFIPASGRRPNAVRARVGRTGTRAETLFFGRVFGKDQFEAAGVSTGASRTLHVVLIMDITGSFKGQIHKARAGALKFMSVLRESHGPDDMIGMGAYYYNFGIEYTPMAYLDDEAAMDAMTAEWAKIDVASKKNGPCPKSYDTGGVNPDMPREYEKWEAYVDNKGRDKCRKVGNAESGTDHHMGARIAYDMLAEQVDPFAFRAVVFLTDGEPVNIRVSNVREEEGYEETRWDFIRGPLPHSKSAIETESVVWAQKLYDELDASVWVVSYKATSPFLQDMAQGQGNFYYTTNSDELVEIFEEIANSMPMVLVE